jgi:methylthioribulose-1-phosphate dehydratase
MPGFSLVSESGVDKSEFTEENLIPVDIETGKLHPDFSATSRKASAETLLHLSIYRETSAGCVLHSHLLEGILFAELYPNRSETAVEGLELLKGLHGITTHESAVYIPCFDNTQDMAQLSRDVRAQLGSDRTFGFLIRRHGLYVWGNKVQDAKRHLEVFEYVFRYYLSLDKISRRSGERSDDTSRSSEEG